MHFWNLNRKNLALDRNFDWGHWNRGVVCSISETEMKTTRVSTCAVRENKNIEGNHLVFNKSIAGIKAHLTVDNRSETELIQTSLTHRHKLNTFKLDMEVKLTLRNEEDVGQILKETSLVDIKIKDHEEQVLCYLMKQNMYPVILKNKKLHPSIQTSIRENRAMI